MALPKALIVGAPRSGTGYIAEVIRHAGVPCGHEDAYGPGGVRESGLPVESSWLAVPYLPALGPEVSVAHQIRNPVAAVRSIAGIAWRTRYRRFTRNHIGPGRIGETQAAWAARLWCDWTEIASEHATAVWRVEDLADVPGSQEAVAQHVSADPAKIAVAVTEVPADVNHREGRPVDMATVPSPLWERFTRLAANYGYEVAR